MQCRFLPVFSSNQTLVSPYTLSLSHIMPHKRAKHSDRVAKRFSLGKDLAPNADDGFFTELPKGAMRILQGAKVQEAHRAKLEAKKKAEQAALTKAKGKAKASTDNNAADSNEASSELTIRPGEKLRDFNARVEQAMAADVRASFKSASRSKINARKRERRKLRQAGMDPDVDPEDVEQEEANRKAKADKAAALEASQPSKADLKRQRQHIQQTGAIKDFAKASQVKKINDVAQAPPTLTRAPRGESVQAKTRKARLIAKITGNDERKPNAMSSSPRTLDTRVAYLKSSQRPQMDRRQAIRSANALQALKLNRLPSLAWQDSACSRKSDKSYQSISTNQGEEDSRVRIEARQEGLICFHLHTTLYDCLRHRAHHHTVFVSTHDITYPDPSMVHLATFSTAYSYSSLYNKVSILTITSRTYHSIRTAPFHGCVLCDPKPAPPQHLPPLPPILDLPSPSQPP